METERDRTAARSNERYGDTLAEKLGKLVGATFILVGILGFIPGITTNYDELTTFDHEGAKLLGIFGVNIIENIVHILFGVVGIMMSRTWSGARTFLIGGGLIYVVLWLFGLVIDKDSSANFMGLNSESDWLHLVLGIALLALGFLVGRDRDRSAAATA